MVLGVKESWEPVIKGFNLVSGGKTVEGDFESGKQYSVQYGIVKKDTLYTAFLCAGCATGYMNAVCAFTQSEYDTIQALLKTARETLTMENSAELDDTVYVWIAGPDGKKYHSSPTCSGMKNPVRITLDEAIRRVVEPCKKCY
jgi:hypothetical protein